MQPPGDGLPVGSYDQRDTESHGKQPERDDRPAAPGRAGSTFMIADRIGGGGVDQPGRQPGLQSALKVHFLVPARSSPEWLRSEEHTSELQSLMRISYAVFCLKKKKQTTT